MIFLPNDSDLFFSINARGETLLVPQKIFPNSKVIDKIKQHGQKSHNFFTHTTHDTCFYINRNKDDMCHVVNYLSGQSFDETKINIIREILETDFEIRFDLAGYDIDKKVEEYERNKKEVISNIYNKIKKEYDFLFDKFDCQNGQYSVHRSCFEKTNEYNSSPKIHDMSYIYIAFPHTHKIIQQYQSELNNYGVDIMKEFGKSLKIEYPFMKEYNGSFERFMIHDNDIPKLNTCICDLKTIKSKVSFYLL